MVTVIGIGPGSKEYLTPIAQQKAEEADVLVGGERALALFRGLNKEMVKIGNNLEEIVDYLKQNKDKKRIAVLVSGDPGFFSFLGFLRRQHFPREELEVIPGISSLQLCMARVASPWHDLKMVSVHGRSGENLASIGRQHQRCAILTEPKFSAPQVARLLLEQGIPNRRVVVGKDLSLATEELIETDLQTLSHASNLGSTIMVIEDELAI
jgi:precorrin-6y C5,15-methyltransferase (decarboxylating) CbiE subunit